MENSSGKKLDSLTGLFDRTEIESHVVSLIKKNVPFVFAVIDIDNFKNVNDGYGHTVGDQVIKVIAKKLKSGVGDRGMVGRFGGDEFIVVAENITEYDDSWKFCRSIFDHINGVEIENYPGLFITVTLGLSRFPCDASTYDEIFETADKALYRGKIKGRSCFIIYLAEKHKDIKLLSSKDTSINSMQRHADIFSSLNNAKTFSRGIKALFKNLCVSLMIDHICIQADDKLYFNETYALAKSKKFAPFDEKLIKENLNPSNGIFFVNDISKLEYLKGKPLAVECEQQNILSMFFAKIAYGKEFYGYLRADSETAVRIWQNKDMDLLLTAASLIATKLHYEKVSFEEMTKGN
ncbi:MAG: GGDEF domain-containing protein [Treponema sp.]|nr:GGDEF domain-containing protein [Candidatus Treponema equifaecale]